MTQITQKKTTERERKFSQEVMRLRGLDFPKLGMAIEVDGKRGRIVGINRSANFDVVFGDEKFSFNCHPFWRTKYFDDAGTLLKEYGDNNE